MPPSPVPEIDARQPVDLAALTAAGQPMVLRGLVADWPTCHAAAQSPEALSTHLRSFANQQQAELFTADAAGGRYFYGEDLAGFNFTRIPATVESALDAILARVEEPALGSAYMGSLPIAAYLPGFSAANPQNLLPPGVDSRLWIGTASRIACHYDAVDNLACVVAGRRRFTLYPPEAISDLYIGPIDHTLAGQPISLATPDTGRHPRFARAQAKALTADLAPGDALYLPKLWWHQVEAETPFNMMVNYWWDAHAIGPDAPMLSMLLAMIAIAERPQAERDAFRAFFEHYVFRAEGHPLAHLPEEQRGILRQIDRAAYGRIRATIMRELRGS
ncbi:cupin-like domain-containing protein [Novosphingobium terrae]|uniref:cupin-like domain-containing protein n=1 Tax=Novosphingobium terrae TaxID=2726189 RepID=UPI00197FA0C8|nr:cupin-like domain-containing protein [Novosphingobium terrae]